jgi:hypothetical protein
MKTASNACFRPFGVARATGPVLPPQNPRHFGSLFDPLCGKAAAHGQIPSSQTQLFSTAKPAVAAIVYLKLYLK